MHNITFISTIHNEIGKCNSIELCKIIEKINPEVIFLEALNETYSKYENHLFTSFGVFHKKLEISAIQYYSLNNSFEFIPVLDNGLSDAFEKKYNLVCDNKEWQKLIDNYNSLAKEHGFEFLNCIESIKLQEEMRVLESSLLNGHKLEIVFNEEIESYENSMMNNIYSYCKNNNFNSAIYLCGVAHRKSIIEKIEKFNSQEHLKLNWNVFGD
ncbi:hypothetical protein [Flavobacterium urocaniciphilum]|uniref:Haem-binding uptake, Tiki superfamily, ChaN n=1 Tax=Flavobacterium urocaniciphilum TaxID=1299341 RepID=A0A1H9D6B5_9FLAO|nr:hypothetical protein [Flavobacterium urocaniciphilum]SEQ08919.1 hypothetical protein SAMN05444005_10654 [Flavobacterium urocaniciphilum]